MKNKKASSFLMKYGVPLVLLIVVVVIQICNPGKALLSGENLTLILTQSAVLGCIALGLGLIMIAGEIDMSIQGMIGMCSLIFTMLYVVGGYHPFMCFLVALAVGIAFSLLSSIMVTKMKISSFVTTIAVMFVTMGVDKSLNKGQTVWLDDTSDTSVKALADSTFGIPTIVWILIAVYVIWYVIVNCTKFGFKLRITGENAQAAKEVGVRTDQIKVIAFICAGVLYAIAAMMEPVRTGGAILYAGEHYLLPAMAANFLGSTMFVPGRVNVLGTFVGAIFMMVITNFMTYLGMVYYAVSIIQGALLIVSVVFANINNREIKQNKM